MQKAPKNISVDGKLTEWGDSLAMFDNKSKLHYAIAKDDTDLYVAITATDRMVKRKIMAAGITISVNPEGKKHKTYSLTYPYPEKQTLSSFARFRGEDSTGNFQKPTLIQSTSIGVTGFKDVESEVITTANTYGFKAAMKFDEENRLVYEIAIPLKFMDTKPKESALAINISVNGIQRPAAGGQGRSGGEGGMGGMGGGGMGGGGMGGGGMGGGGRGGRGGGMGGGRGGNRESGGEGGQDKSGMAESVDFWVKIALAK